MQNIFITGTDVNVGKTFISAGLAATMQSLGYSTCVYKPIQTGSIEQKGFMQSPDLAFVSSIDPYIKTFSTYLLKEQAVPVIAAEEEKITIDKNLIKQDLEAIENSHDCTIVEGTGGVMTPVSTHFLMSDLIKALNLPVILVAKAQEGMINKTLMTINHAHSKGLKIRGIIINGFPADTDSTDIKTSPRLIEEYSDIKILGIVRNFPNAEKITPSELITNILNGIDIESVFDVKISKLDME